MIDYFALEPLIIARLREKLTDISIRSTWGAPKIHETTDLPPAILLFLEDDQPGSVVENGACQKIEQTWLCLVVVNDPGNEAGPLISRVIRALSGWTPAESRFAAFKRVRSNFSPDCSANGVYYFPLAFSTSFVFNIH
ncbi:MAG: hypothetical protein HQL97_17415 [Magnetococcales bacterium]|nr:hypothetical protein [Magnetococcales bacterium]